MDLSPLRKAGVAAATVAAVDGASLGASALAASSGTAGRQTVTAAPAAAQPLTTTAAPHAGPRVASQVIGKGVVDGRAWSVALEFYPTLPKGFVVPTMVGKRWAGKSSLVCQRMVIGGVRIDHQDGPWADCDPVDGTHDPSRADEAGLWGLHDKGTRGTRLFVANPEVDVAYGMVHLSDGTRLTATTVTVPGTGYRAWAGAIPAGTTITAVDSYNAAHHRLSHDTNWR